MKRRIAVLDLGTNTFHLMISDVIENEVVQQVVSVTKDVRLGEGGINRGIITKDAFNRGLAALRSFQELIRKYTPDIIFAAGTAALRSASNSKDFIQQVKAETGIEISLIDGTREAELIFEGVKQAVEIPGPALIMDIGGGSVEFIFCDKNEVFHKKSYPIGAARLMEQFHHSDPIAEEDVLEIHRYLDEQLADLKINAHIFKPQLLIGSAGAFETFADLAIQKFSLPSRINKKCFSFNTEHLEAVIADILKSTHEERTSNTAIIPIRVDMIVVSSILSEYILEELQITNVALSTYALKEGLLFQEIS